MLFVIFHGSYGNGDENWFPDLKTCLTAIGQEVLSPSLPVDDWDLVSGGGTC